MQRRSSLRPARPRAAARLGVIYLGLSVADQNRFARAIRALFTVSPDALCLGLREGLLPESREHNGREILRALVEVAAALDADDTSTPTTARAVRHLLVIDGGRARRAT